MTDQTGRPHRVVIAGGGVGGLEALLALRDLARDRVALTLLSPTDEFSVRALSVEDPFGRPTAARYPLARICADQDARFVQDSLDAVDTDDRSVLCAGGRRLAYDSLLVAVGARTEPVYPRVITFRGLQDAEAVHGLIQDVEGGWSTQVAFVVPPGVSWPLPLYELALMTAERARGLGLAPGLVLYTPEDEPLGVFGATASAEVERLLADAGVALRTATYVRAIEGGTLLLSPGDQRATAERVVALPRLHGPRPAGLPADPDGFLPVDDHGRVAGTHEVFAAGDGTSFALKQGGLAAQQADAAARSIARRAGADVAAPPFRPTLRGKLLTGRGNRYLSEAISGGAGTSASTASEEPLWWPAAKVAAAYLAPYLERLDAAAASR